MTSVIETLLYYVWHEKFWFPGNLTWESLRNKDDGIYHPQVSDMFIPLVLAVVLFLFRMIFERYIATPVGLYVGVPPPKIYHHHIDHPTLWRLYKLNRNPSDTMIHLRIALFTPENATVKCFYHYANCSLHTWRFTFYISVFSFGTYVLWDKPWFSDTLQCWIGYPHHHVTSDLYWYMMIELAYYWSALFSQFRDIRRKDAAVMLIHHISTIILMVCGWMNAHVRSCTLIVYIHDSVDYLMEAAKMAKYSRHERLCNVCFVVFLLAWFITRLIILPTRILYHTLLHAHVIVGHYPFYWIYNGLMLVLQALHIIWFYMICRIAYRALTAGSVQGDVRSETQDTSTEDEEHINQHLHNGIKH